MQSPGDFLPLARYRSYLLPGEDSGMGLQRYGSDIRLAEALYPALALFEVCLRNRLDSLICSHYGDRWLIDANPRLLNARHLQKLAEDKQNFIARKNKRMTQDDAVAGMSFGFWTNFFHKQYDTVLWHKKGALQSVLPYWRGTSRLSRSLLREKANLIQGLRNRMAHCEPVWRLNPPLPYIHAWGCEFISAMSKDAFELLGELDRFPQVWAEFQHVTGV